MPTSTTTATPRKRTSRQETTSLVTLDPTTDTERLVKSVERVRDLGEVFTPAETVQSMLDMLPVEMWDPHPSATFLEPACGDGNFVVAILDRKLNSVLEAYNGGTLPAGTNREGLQFHVLEALASIYAVDLSADNVVGGTPGHEVGARQRLINHLVLWYSRSGCGRITARSPLYRSAVWVVDRNIQVGNMLPTNPDGSPSGREAMPLVEYSWTPPTRSVSVSSTTLGAVMTAAETETTGVMTLFGTAGPSVGWTGMSSRLHEAPIPTPVTTIRHTSNGDSSIRR